MSGERGKCGPLCAPASRPPTLPWHWRGYRATIGFMVGVASTQNRNRAPDVPFGMLGQVRHFAYFRVFSELASQVGIRA